MTYDSKVAEAIQGSIDKWIGIAYEGKEDGGVDDCPLCGLFYDGCRHIKTIEAVVCRQCPVRLAGGCCLNRISPYRLYAHRNPFGMMMYLMHLAEWYELTAERV